MTTVLHLDDDKKMLTKASNALAVSEFTCSFGHIAAFTREEFYEKFNAQTPDCVLLDIIMGEDDFAGVRILKNLRTHGYSGAIIMMSSVADPLAIRACVSAGASDFISKGLDEPELAFRISQCVETHQKLFRDRASNTAPVAGRTLREIELKILRIRDSRIKSVLVTGESGTGKEVVGECLRQCLPQGTPFVPVNCGAIAKDLLEAELFGHEKGAFTGAASARPGLFTSAHGGWIFLDEVARLSLACQAALLRTLENGEIRPVGSAASRRVNVRVLAATNEDLDGLVESGDFRGDLLSRLRSYEIFLPPLRERGAEETAEILDALLYRLNSDKVEGQPAFRMAPSVRQLFFAHTWKRGNVREMWQVLQATTVDAVAGLITVNCLPKSFLAALDKCDQTQLEKMLSAADDESVEIKIDKRFDTLTGENSNPTFPAPASSNLNSNQPLNRVPPDLLPPLARSLPHSLVDLENTLFFNCLVDISQRAPGQLQSQRKVAAALGITRHSFVARLQRVSVLQEIPEFLRHLLPDKEEALEELER